MSSLLGLATRPAHVATDAHFGPWFARVADRMLNEIDFVVAGETYRFAELEVYYHGAGHFDLFAHRNPVQVENGRWYFHRTGGKHRGGSFKGLDLALGDGTAHVGILIRTVIHTDGTVLDGPCVTVDHLLAKTKAASVAALDGIIGTRKIWDATAPLFIRESTKTRTATVYRSSRVGLSLKKASGKPDAPLFVARPYRFLTDPRAISKGKPHLVLALHQRGESPQAISHLVGCPKKTVERYIEDFTAGQSVPNFDVYIGKGLSTGELCRMLGTWSVNYGKR